MKNALAIFGILVLGFVSCKKDNKNESIIGVYTESTPVAGRSRLHFVNAALLVRYEAGSTHRDSFTYSISHGKITITPIWTDQHPATEFEFEVLNEKTLKIQNLYASIPKSPKSYMIYIR